MKTSKFTYQVRQTGYFILLAFFPVLGVAQNVGIETTTPDSTLSIANKVEIGGAQGDIVFTDDQASLIFPTTTLPNSPMMYMFESGGSNADRMVIAHSPLRYDWGLQFKDVGDEFHFLADGKHAMSLDLNVNGASMALADAVLHEDYTFNVRSTNDLRTLHILNEHIEPMESTYAVYASNNADGSQPKYAGQFRSIGSGTGSNVALWAFASGSDEQNVALFAEASGQNGVAADFASGDVYVNDSMVIGGDVLAAGYRLSVDGKIIGEELRIELSQQWPDYVFQNDYDLMSIDALEKSIDLNGHLPGIPSAQAVKENGLMVGDMQKRMMEKIEELTLYVIDLNKKNRALEEKVLQLTEALSDK